MGTEKVWRNQTAAVSWRVYWINLDCSTKSHARVNISLDGTLTTRKRSWRLDGTKSVLVRLGKYYNDDNPSTQWTSRSQRYNNYTLSIRTDDSPTTSFIKTSVQKIAKQNVGLFPSFVFSFLCTLYNMVVWNGKKKFKFLI